VWPLAGPRRRDDWHAVVEALEQIQVLRDPAGRGLCLDLLTQYLGLSLQVRHFPSTRQHLYSILLACDQHPAALPTFLRVLSELEPGSRGVLSAQRMLSDDVPRQRGELVRLDEAQPDPPVRIGGSGMPATSSEQPVHSGQRSAGQPAVWGGVPPRNENFTGRAHLLDAVRDRLDESMPTAVVAQALHGMGGVGKSQTAVEFAYRHAADYELIWWIPAEEPALIQTALVELAMRLRLPVEPSTESAVPAVLTALRTGDPYPRWLLIFDNADRPQDVLPFFPTGPGHVLVTSRNVHWSAFARTIEVDVFTRSESRQLLQRRSRGLTDTQADQLAEALGDLPLAVEQAGAWSAETEMPVEEYLRLLEDKRLALSGSAAGYPVAVAAAWNVSMDRLRADNTGAFDLLRVCAFFAPEPISRTLFVAMPEIPGHADLTETVHDQVLLNRAIRDINRYGLARIDHRDSTIQLHRLVQMTLRNQLSEPEYAEVRHVAHLILASADPDQADSVANWPRYAELMGHVVASQAADCANQRVRRLAINILVFLFAWGDPNGAKDMAAGLVEKWRTQLGPHHRDTLVASRWLGRALRQVGEFNEARHVGEAVLRQSREHLGNDHEDTLLAAHAVASDLRAKGDFSAARDLNEDAYRRARARFGDDDPDTLAAANNYALSRRLCGELDAARRLDEDTWRRKVTVLGENHRHTLLTLDNWCVDLMASGAWLEAARIQEHTVRRFREHVGVRHPMTLCATKNLAVARRTAGDLASALPLGQVALDGLVSRYGERQPDAMSAAMNVSVNLRQLGRLEEARRLGIHVHRLYDQAWGSRHPFTLAAATNLATTLHALGELATARGLNEKALNGMRERLGEDHPFNLVCAMNLANDLARGGRYDQARDLGTDTIGRARRALPDNHPWTLAAITNLALDLRGLGQIDESADLQRDAVTRLREALGPEHPATVNARMNRRTFGDIDAPQI
jgi:tetratricopeptide (TPR) repeat protein